MTAPESPRGSGTIGRRELLRALGIGGTAVIVAGSGALSFRALETDALRPGEGDAYEAWNHWQQHPGLEGAVAAAVLAASPHNTQPWLFSIGGNIIDVFVDKARTTGSVDPSGREQMMGVGCAIENLILACRHRGLAPQVELLPDGVQGNRVARVSVAAGPRASSPLYDAIGKRHTNRGPYLARQISTATLGGLVDASDCADLNVHWITGHQERQTMGRLLVAAASALVADVQQSMDNFAWFRSNSEEIQRHRDGLTLDGQGFGPLMLALAKLMPASSRQHGDRFWVKQTETVHTATAAAYGVITTSTPENSRRLVQAGRLLQRIHLTATSQGIALHHMNQITERIDREAATGHKPTFAARFAKLLPAGQQPLLTFRVGYAERDARPSPRRPADQVTRHNTPKEKP